MTATLRLFPAWILLVVLSLCAPSATAQPPSPSLAIQDTSKPRLASLPLKVRWSISAALAVARTRLRQKPTCRELFTRLGADGLEKLAAIRLRAASTDEDLSLCAGRSAAAFTEVGSGRVTICPALFSELTREQASTILIHEALHYAGLGEWPEDPNGLTSREITQRVRHSCGR